MAPHIRSHRAPCSCFPENVSLQLSPEQSVGDVGIRQLDWKNNNMGNHCYQITDTVRVVCAAGVMKLSHVRLSVRPSVRPPPRPLRRVCCCGPGGREISISCCTAAAQQQMRTVSRCQLNTDLLAHALVSIVVIDVLQLCCSYNASRGQVSAGEMIQILLTYGHRGSVVISQTTLQCLVTGQKHCSFIDGQERGSESCYMHATTYVCLQSICYA